MEHHLHPGCAAAERVEVADVPDHEFGCAIDVVGNPGGEVVDHDHGSTVGDEPVYEVGPDEPCTSGDERAHHVSMVCSGVVPGCLLAGGGVVGECLDRLPGAAAGHDLVEVHLDADRVRCEHR